MRCPGKRCRIGRTGLRVLCAALLLLALGVGSGLVCCHVLESEQCSLKGDVSYAFYPTVDRRAKQSGHTAWSRAMVSHKPVSSDMLCSAACATWMARSGHRLANGLCAPLRC